MVNKMSFKSIDEMMDFMKEMTVNMTGVVKGIDKESLTLKYEERLPMNYLTELVNYVKSLDLENPTIDILYGILLDYDGEKAGDYVFGVADEIN